MRQSPQTKQVSHMEQNVSHPIPTVSPKHVHILQQQVAQLSPENESGIVAIHAKQSAKKLATDV